MAKSDTVGDKTARQILKHDRYGVKEGCWTTSVCKVASDTTVK